MLQPEQFDVIGMPTTLYRQDPEKVGFTEWYELAGARDRADNWYFLERRGWWDSENKKPHFDVPILSEPHKTEADVLTAIRARIKTLDSEGWTYKFTRTFDPERRQFVSVRI
jgi:hypothetical protein